MHQQPLDFIARVRAHRDIVVGDVAEAGSLNMNGSTRDTVLADHESWVGVDWRAGNGVDVVEVFHEWQPARLFDTVVSTEMLEHDPHWRESLRQMVLLCRLGGNIIITCAARARPRHEVHVGIGGHYQGLDVEEVLVELRAAGNFHEIIAEQNSNPADTYVAALGKKALPTGRLAVVIPSCNARYAIRCLSTHRALEAGESEYIVVANGMSVEDKDRMLATAPAHVSVFYDRMLGYPAACNIGMRLRHHWRAQAVALVNDDTEAIINGWDARVLDILTGEGPQVGALSPVTNFIANPQQMYSIIPTPEIYEATHLFFVWVAFPVAAIEAVGFLDERVGLGNFEDLDYSFRLHDAGLHLLVDPVHIVYHRGHGTFGTFPPGHFDALLRSAHAAMKQKWGQRLPG